MAKKRLITNNMESHNLQEQASAASMIDRVHNKEQMQLIIDQFVCMIHQDLVLEPVECEKCEAIFCKACIDTWITEFRKDTCPNCKKEIRTKEISRKFKNLLGSIRLDCHNKDKGCNETIPYEKIEQHKESCPYSVKECPGCNTQVQKALFDAHYYNECKEAIKLEFLREKESKLQALDEINRLEKYNAQLSLSYQQLERRFGDSTAENNRLEKRAATLSKALEDANWLNANQEARIRLLEEQLVVQESQDLKNESASDLVPQQSLEECKRSDIIPTLDIPLKEDTSLKQKVKNFLQEITVIQQIVLGDKEGNLCFLDLNSLRVTSKHKVSKSTAFSSYCTALMYIPLTAHILQIAVSSTRAIVAIKSLSNEISIYSLLDKTEEMTLLASLCELTISLSPDLS